MYYPDKSYAAQNYQPERYYDERRPRERQIVECGSYGTGGSSSRPDRDTFLIRERVAPLISERNQILIRERDPVLIRERDPALFRERDPVLIRERDPHLVRETIPILVRERYLDRYHRDYLENDAYLHRQEGHFPGPPPQQFPEPRMPPPSRMPYYQQQHSHRALPSASGPRPVPSWQRPYHRNNPPRRRHHLDDIFLPNHDDGEHPEEAGFRSRHTRPPTRFEIKTTPINARGENVSDTKSHERTVINPNDKTKDKLEVDKKSESAKLYVKQSNKTVVKSRDIDKPCDVPKSVITTINEGKCKTKTCKEDVSSHEKVVELSNSKAKSVDKVELNKSSKHVKSDVQGVVKNSNNSKTACASKSVVPTTKTNNASTILNYDTTNIELHKKNGTKSNDNPISVSTISKEVDINKTKNDNYCQSELKGDKVLPKPSTSTLEKEKVTNQTTDELENSLKIKLNQTCVMSAPDLTNNETKCELQIVNSNIKQVSNGNQIEKQDRNSRTVGNNISESSINVNKKSVKVKLFKNDVENKEYEKLQNKDYVTDTTTEKVIQEISNSDNDTIVQQADKPKNISEKKNIDNNDKVSTIQLNDSGNYGKSIASQILIKEKISSDSEIDIVTELEALVNNRDDYALQENKNAKEKEIDNKLQPKDKHLNSMEQRQSLEETGDATRNAAPSSPQAIRKDIIIKLIRTPQPKSPLVADKCSPQSKDPLAPCNHPPVPTSPLATNTKNKHVKENDVHTNHKHITKNPSTSVINTDNSNNPILEDIFILEEALKTIDNAPEIIDVPPSPPKNDGATNDSIIKTQGVKGDEIITVIDVDEVQIIEEEHDTIEIVDDDNDNVHLSSTAINDSHNKTTTPIIVIKDESPVDCERMSKSSTWRDQPPEGFGTLDTRGSYLFTFHQRFDDPRVVDMDICHTPSPPTQSEQQKETDRVIKDMDALWNQISESKDTECSSEASKEGKGITKSNKDIKKHTSMAGDHLRSVALTLNQMNNKKVKKCQQSQELKNAAFGNQNGKGDNTRVACANQDLNYMVRDAFYKTVKRVAGHPRRASFSHTNSNIDSFNISLRKTKSLSDIVSIITVDSNFSVLPALRNVLAERAESSSVANNKNVLSSLRSSEYKDQISDVNICVNDIVRNDSTMSDSRKVDVMPKPVPNNLITADGNVTDDSDVLIRAKRKSIKEIKRKRVMRIESSDEDSTEARELKKDEPKQKKQKLQDKPTRKRKIPVDDKAKNKEFKKNVAVSRTSPVSGERQAQYSKTNECTASSKKKLNYSSPEKLAVSAAQPSTKYVTKAEYIKSFARSQSSIPNISLSIQPIPKTQKIKQRRATFTCEADNETILKKVDGGERCKQKFRDLFGSVSEDEEDLIQVPCTDVCKTSCEVNKTVEDTRIPPETRTIPNTQSSKLDSGTKRKRRKSCLSKPFIEESDSSDSSRVISNSKTALPSDHNVPKPSKTLKHSKMPNINSNDSDNCKRSKIQNEHTVQIRQKNTDGIRLPQSKDRSLIKGQTETSSSKLKREKCNEKSKATNVDNENKDSNKKLCLVNRRESTSSTDSRSRDSSCQAFRKEKKSLDKTQMKADERISRSPSKESDSSRKATNVDNENTDANKKIGVGSRRESTSSTDTFREEKKSPDKNKMKSDGRISRSRSKESDSSRISNADKHVSKNDHSKFSSERSFDKDCSKSLKYQQHASKGISLQQERMYSDCRRESTSSIESNTSGHTHRKKESTDRKILESNVHRRKSLSKDKTISDENDKGICTVALKQKHEEVKRISCSDRVSLRAAIKTCEPIKESKKENVTECTKTYTKRRTLLVETSDSFDKRATESSKDTSLIEHKEQRKLVAQKLKATYIKGTVSPIKKVIESFRRNSAPDILSSSSETSLIIEEIEDLPLLYRASENEVNEDFQICKAYITHVPKRDKITKLGVVDAECIDRVHISDPPEIYTDGQTIKQTHKEDDDVIEIRPVIPMIDLTEEDTRINRESSPKETLADLMIEAKKEIEELSQDQATITLYRSEEDDSNQDQEVQAIAASIPSVLQKNNYSQIKKDKDLLQQDATIVSTSGAALQASSNSNISNNIEIPVSHGPTIVENSVPISTDVEIPQPPAIPPSSLEDENQRAVSLILDIQQNSPSSRVITDSVDDLQCSTNSVLETEAQTVNTVNESLNVDNFEPVEQDNNLEKQNDPTTAENQNTISEPHEVSQALPIHGTEFDKRPRIMVRPTMVEKSVGVGVDSGVLTVRQDQMVQEDSFGQHKGLPQTLREYRPIHRVRGTGIVVPPALVNINLSRSSPQKKKYTGKQTNSQNVGNSPTQSTEVETTCQIARAPENNQSFVDLTQDNGELSTMDLRLIVDIFTRHAFFLAHLCEAQNGYIEYLQKQSFCQNYFKAEIALFEEQRQARLLSQSLRLVTELQNLNIRATRNLSGSASEIVEQIAVNLVSRAMPKHVTKSMVYLLIAKLIKPQSDIFSRVPLLKALIRICNVVLSRMVSRYPNLSENQMKILTHQVEVYNRLFGGPSRLPNQANTSPAFVRPNLNPPTLTNLLTTDVQSTNKTVRPVQINQSLVRNIEPISRSRDDLLGNQVDSGSGQSINGSGQQIPSINSRLSANVVQPTINSIDLSPMVSLEHQIGSPRQSHLNYNGGSVIESRNVYSGPPNISLGLNTTTQTESSPTIYQASIGHNRMTPPNGNYMPPPNVNVSAIRQHRFASPRQSSSFVVPNQSRQMINSVRPVRDLPGGANTNTLGRTPRYIPNYGTSTPSNVYAPLGKPRPPSLLQNVGSVSRIADLLNSCPPPTNSNSQGIGGTLSNQNALHHTSNSILSTLLTDSNSSSEGTSKHTSVPKNPQLSNNSEPRILQDSGNNMALASPRYNVVTQTPRRNAASQRSTRRLPSYEESVGSRSIHQPSSSSPNQLPPDEAKKRNENLLKELLCTPDNDPVFGRSSSPANDNFRIKLPFTQPDITRSTTTSANNTLSMINDNASFLTGQSNTPVLSTGVSTVFSQTSNTTPIASNLITVVVTSAQPIIQNNPVIICSQPNVRQPNMISLSSQSVTSLAPILWVNNAVGSTSYVVAQPKQTIILNQGLEALSSIGPVSAMLNLASNHVTNSQSAANVQNYLQNQVLSIADQPLLQSCDALQTVSPNAGLNNSDLSQPQSPICVNKNAVGDNQKQVSIQPRPSPPFVKAAVVDEGKTSERSSPKFKVISAQTRKQTNTKRSKPESGTKSKPKKKRGPGKRKKEPLTKTIVIVDLLSSDEDMTSENQSGEEERASEETVDSNVTTEDSKQDTTDNQTATMQQPSGSEASLSTLDMRNQDQEAPADKSESSNLQAPNPRSQIEELQPSTSNSSNRLEGASEEDEIETIDLTWIDEMDDQELQREMDFVFIKKEEPRDENEEAQEQNNMVVSSPADSGISSPPVQNEDDTTVYTVNVQRLCICSKTAEYNCVCGEAWYCGQDCQLKDWSSHQKVCQIYHEAMDTEEECTVNEQIVNTQDETT